MVSIDLPILGKVGAPVLVGIAAGVATPYLLTGILGSSLRSTADFIEQNKALEGVAAGVGAMVATAVLLNTGDVIKSLME